MPVLDYHKELSTIAGWENYTPVSYDSASSWPRISVVIPSFNQGAYIETTLLSLLAQQYPALEIIVMDGGSTDKTVNVLKKYEDFLTFWVSEKDNGQSDAINKGLAKCTGELFNWLNSDDYLMPGALHEVAKAFWKTGALAISSGTYNIRNNRIESVIPPVNLQGGLFQTIHYTGFNQPGFFYQTKIVKDLKGVDEYYHFGMDLDLWNRFLFTYGLDNVCTTNVVIAGFRLHEESKTEVQTNSEFSLFDQDITEMYFSYARGTRRKFCFKWLNPGMQYQKEKPKTVLPKERVNAYFNQYFYLKFLAHLYRFRVGKALVALLGIQPSYFVSSMFVTIVKKLQRGKK